MEKEINIAEILKDKPKGTKLYADAFGELSLGCINNIGISTITKAGSFRNFYNNGIYSKDGEPILVPSKKMRDWSKFAWKKGDILVNGDKDVHVIFEAFENDTYTRFKGKHYLWKEGYEEDYCKEETFLLTSVFEKVNDDAVKCYINTIEKRLGGKLNRETLEIEKPQPEFKDGDIVVYGKSVAICRKIYKSTIYFYVSIDETFGLLSDDNRVSAEGYRYATEAEKQQLFEALAKEGKRWNAERKIIEDAKKEYQFKPFEKVLARDSKDSLWHIDLYEGMLGDDSEYNYSCMASDWVYCIPYEENEQLLGTTKDIEEDYEGNQE